MTNVETPKYPREIRMSKPPAARSDRDTLFGWDSRFGIRYSFVLGYLGVSSFSSAAMSGRRKRRPTRTRPPQNVITGLARRRTFLSYTNHLSNDELYRLLWVETLNEATHELDDSMGDCACHIDLLSDGSEQSNLLRLQYYADELERNDWLDAFPDDTLPPHLDPPYDRDRHLPQRSGKPT